MSENPGSPEKCTLKPFALGVEKDIINVKRSRDEYTNVASVEKY